MEKQGKHKLQEQQQNDYEEDADTPADNYESYSDFQYDLTKSEVDETDSMVDNQAEECEETVIYEIIDEI